MSRALTFAAIGLLVAFAAACQGQGPGSVQGSAQPAGEAAFDQALDRARQGYPEEATLLLQRAVEEARQAGDLRQAAYYGIYLGQILSQLGRSEQAVNVYFQASVDGQGTDLAHTADAIFRLSLAGVFLAQGHLGACLDMLDQVKPDLRAITDPTQHQSVESQALTLEINALLQGAEAAGAAPASLSAAALSAELQVFLAVALRGAPFSQVAPSFAENGTVTDLPAEQIAWLDAHKPWSPPLFERALRLNSQVTEIDRRRDPAIAEIEVAKDRSQRAEILAALGRFDQARTEKTAALATFVKVDSFPDVVAALDGLIDIELRSGTAPALESAFQRSQELVRRIESQSLVLVGRTIPDFMKPYRRAYGRHQALLLDRYRRLSGQRSPAATAALAEVLLHADRTLFRPLRRDLSLYRSIGADLSQRPDRAAALKKETDRLRAAAEETVQAQEEGKGPEAYQPAPGLIIDSPYANLSSAKEELLSSLEDLKRQAFAGKEVLPELPATLAQVQRGMTAADAIVLFMSEPGAGGDLALSAGVIRADSFRRVELKIADLERLAQALKGLQDPAVLRSAAIDKTLDELSGLLWHPLGDLPERITVVLTPWLIGVPFEALKTRGGKRVVEEHILRYAFGLAEGLGAGVPAGGYKVARVLGAETFSVPGLDPLPASRAEVEGVRRILTDRGLSLAPGEALPGSGRTLLEPARVDVVHISTHSVTDDDTPLFDSLVFPQDQVFAYELGLTPLRARLAVLSACQLFSVRDDRYSPVSGLTTAVLANVAPQVVSTLWEINPETTRIFMLRFYAALAEQGDPAAALAVTKRDFLEPARLRESLRQAGFTAELDLAAIRRPYSWAPFVLVVQGQR